MAMITKLVVKDAKIIEGRSIESKGYHTKNQALALSTQPLSRLLFWFLECDSNNTVRTLNPRDIRSARNQFALFKKELKLYLKHNADQPMGKMEMEHTILVPDEHEMKKFSNGKLRRVAYQVLNLIKVCMGSRRPQA